MFDFLKGSETTGSGASEKKELSIEKRLLLAFVLMGAVLFTTPYFFKTPPAPPAAAKKGEPAPAAGTPPQTAVQPGAKPPEPAAPSAAPAGQVSAQREETVTVETDIYRIVFWNRGAVVQSWVLKKYKDSASKPLELVNTAAAPQTGFPFSLDFKNTKPAVDLNNVLYAVNKSDDGLEISFEYSDGKVSARKTFHFTKNAYQSQVTTEVHSGGVPVPHLIQWRGGFGDMTVPSPVAAQHGIYYDANAGKLVTTEAKEAKNGPVSVVGSFSFAGLEDTYFTAAFLPGSGPVEMKTFDDKAPTPHNSTPEQLTGAAVGGEGINKMALFVGPKDLDILKQVNPKLEQVVDFGWFSFIAKPLFLVMHWLTDNYIHNYGWSIILMTIFINFALFPLKISSMKSMKKVMALYSKHGVNPLGGCMPMALQMPFLFAFYKVFSIAIEMRGASWLWVTDLSQHETIPIHLLPIAMIATQFIMQKMTPATTGGDPAQQKVMMFMPLMFGFMFYNASAGLVLYWLTGNIVNIAQQWFFNRTAVAADVAQSVQVTKKKNGRK